MNADGASREHTLHGDSVTGLYAHDTFAAELKRRSSLIERKGRSVWSRCFLAFSRIQSLHSILSPIICAVEGGTMFSQTLRLILNRYYGVEVGMYSYGECLKPGRLPPGTRIGNYCSIADSLLVLRRNHPIDWLSQHPFFFNHEVGLVPKDSIGSIESNPLVIGHDVWIGSRVIVTPRCKSIGNGAVVAAGAVVAEDVPPFEVVGGVPAKRIRSRFPVEVQGAIEESEWWLRPLSELSVWLEWFQHPLDPKDAQKLSDFLKEIEKPGYPARCGN
jgi:acetyltransferase-like isoleucine patch superfamily enzyme